MPCWISFKAFLSDTGNNELKPTLDRAVAGEMLPADCATSEQSMEYIFPNRQETGGVSRKTH